VTAKTLSKAQAERLVRKINESIEATTALIIQAFEGQAHLALGYKDWQAFAAAELPHFKYSPEDRMKASMDLTEAGLSTRSAAAALGVDQKTVVRDVRSHTEANASAAGELPGAETAPEEAAPVPESTAPTKRRKVRKNPVVAAERGAQVRKQVDEYRTVMAKHPTWAVKAVQQHLRISHQDVGRRRLFSQAPGEAQGYLYSGQITPAVAETVLSNAYVKDDDKLVVLRKFATGVITTTGAPKVREIMKTIPQIQPYPDLVLRWSSPDLKMTFDELHEELIDLRNASVVSKREQAQQAAETRMLAESGFNAMAWLDEMAQKIGLVEEMWPVLSANPWVRAKLEKKLAENGDRLIRLSRLGGPRPTTSTAEESSGSPVILGEIVN
jgi:transposase-like protein